MDTLSRLKGIETISVSALNIAVKSVALDTLSRLKGIETKSQSNHRHDYGSLDTLSRLNGIETIAGATEEEKNPSQLWIHFPVGTESKLPEPILYRVSADSFGYTFPLERNRNFSCPLFVLFLLLTLDTLSRLNGIETFAFQ